MVFRRSDGSVATGGLPTSSFVNSIRTTIYSGPFTPADVQKILKTLTTVQQCLSISFIMSGMIFVWMADSAKQATVWNSTTFSGICGLFASVVGAWTLSNPARYTRMVTLLFCSILASVGALIQVVVTGIWVTSLFDKLESPQSMIGYWILILAAVANGISFIFTATFICRRWEQQHTMHNLDRLSRIIEPLTNDRVTHLHDVAHQALVDVLV